MAVVFNARNWLRLPSRVAVLLGMGAISAASAQVDASPVLGQAEQPELAPPQSLADREELRIWSDDGRIYLSESGRPARELLFDDTAEARRLKNLLEGAGAFGGAAGIRLDRIILAGGGGDGFHFAPPRTPAISGTAPVTASTGHRGTAPVVTPPPVRPENTDTLGRTNATLRRQKS